MYKLNYVIKFKGDSIDAAYKFEARDADDARIKAREYISGKQRDSDEQARRDGERPWAWFEALSIDRIYTRYVEKEIVDERIPP